MEQKREVDTVIVSGEQIKSHIQIPKLILKNFQGANGKVAYLDLQQLRIRYYTSKELGTEMGYYSAEMEEYLNHERETPFSILAAKAKRFTEHRISEIKLSVVDEAICKEFLNTCAARGELALKHFMDSSITAQFFSPQANHDQLVYIASTMHPNLSDIYRDHKLVIMENCSGVLFVVPRNCFYIVQSNGFSIVIIPVSPGCALALVPPEYDKNMVNGEERRYCIFRNPEDALRMNIAALQYEYAFNKCFVVSQRREEIETIKKFAEKHREELELLYSEVNG